MKRREGEKSLDPICTYERKQPRGLEGGESIQDGVLGIFTRRFLFFFFPNYFFNVLCNVPL